MVSMSYLARVDLLTGEGIVSKCGRCAKSAGSGGSFRAGASHFEISPATPPRADLTTTATTDDYDTTFGPYKTGKMGDASVTASSWRLVERGRVVLFKKGQYAGKLAAIAQIIDHRRVLVEGFSSDASKVVPRHAAPLAYVTLTGIVIPKVPLGVGHTALQKLWNNEKVEEKWANSKTAKTSAKLMRRRQLNDFERFKVMVLRKQARFETRKTLASSRGKKA
ncbi:hypothetical protein D0863_12852 [Hortaea werneckii]|uniref:Large ribosomal subunit protein eL14 domain-containing protein n=1 Tax=Hortaea werneckii TaxID=91943 RepID=A0A3M7CYI2_HORWE|nr:hypothetical protein D0863_12852 [Hortaea werneckii]